MQPAFAYKYRTRAQPQPASETASSAASFSFQGLSSTPEKSIRHARNKQPPQQPEDSCKPQGRSSSALKLALVGAALVVCAVKVSLFGWCSLQSHTAAMCSRCCQALTLACYSQKAAQPSLLCRCAILWQHTSGCLRRVLQSSSTARDKPDQTQSGGSIRGSSRSRSRGRCSSSSSCSRPCRHLAPWQRLAIQDPAAVQPFLGTRQPAACLLDLCSHLFLHLIPGAAVAESSWPGSVVAARMAWWKPIITSWCNLKIFWGASARQSWT